MSGNFFNDPSKSIIKDFTIECQCLTKGFTLEYKYIT